MLMTLMSVTLTEPHNPLGLGLHFYHLIEELKTEAQRAEVRNLDLQGGAGWESRTSKLTGWVLGCWRHPRVKGYGTFQGDH